LKRAALLICLAALPALAQFTPRFVGQSPNGSVGTAASHRSVIVAPGDSITYGLVCDGTPYTTRLASATGRTVLNLGESGNTLNLIRARWESQGNYPDVEWAVLEGGVNDLRQGATGAATWALMKSFIEAAKAAGQRVAVFTILPFAGSPGATEQMETERLAYNASLRSYAASHGVVVIDGDTFLSDGGTPPQLPAADNCGDLLHPNGAGNQLMADHAKTALHL
jgi:lysophospholipase L1-like esterase